MTLSQLDIIQLLAGYHSLLLCLALAMRRRLRGLMVLAGTFGLHMLTNLGVSEGFLGPELDITSAFGLVYGPAFYFFVLGIVEQDRRFDLRDLVHLVPALIIAAWQPALPVPYVFGLPSLAIYIALACRLLLRHGRQSPQFRSDSAAISLGWVLQALIAFAALAALDILREVARLADLGLSDDLALSLVITSVTTLMTAMFVRARAHDDLSGALPVLDIEPRAEEPESTDFGPVFQRINTLLVGEELWREPRLSLAEIASKLRISQRDASRAINLHGGQSFSRYVNRFRVAEVDRLMADPDNDRRTVIELAYEAGFNSKSAFNRIYREETGQTPTQAFQGHKSG
ncbi:helix-turn-helix transcriptional regulator [Maricaulis sp.]|uniref:helix-turn-helix transcriptional regulator n=1 Tax=unclassified Maricaulis TaxID=2632371 RepID=UPI001B245611|nr:helix-turn-helix transcriptional regulator [Maricaulis sp.]MBO6797636.1 helix-turn-helix transcriptional regulator [Maricaulis sp.]